MPSRHRPKNPSSAAPQRAVASASPAASSGSDPAELFAAALKESEARDRETRERERQQRDAAAARRAEAEAEANALRDAKRALDRAIEGVRAAKSSGRGTAEADAAWKAAKAKVIELETGTPPTWAPRPTPEPVAVETDAAGDAGPPPADEAAGDAGPPPADEAAGD
jgi:hypothetical protein